MPTYEYECEAGHEAEVRQSISADPLDTCPRTGCGAPAERKISLGGGLMIGGGRTEGNARPGCGPSGFT